LLVPALAVPAGLGTAGAVRWLRFGSDAGSWKRVLGGTSPSFSL